MKHTEESKANGAAAVSKPRTKHIVRVLALLLCVSAFAITLALQSGEVQVDDDWPPLSAWEGAPITLAYTQLTVPVGTELTQESILTACGAEAQLEGQFVVSGLNANSTEQPGEIIVQITLQDEDHVALGSVFLKVHIVSE